MGPLYSAVSLSLVALLGAAALGLFVGTLVVGRVAGAALSRAISFTRLALRPARSIGELDSGPRRMHGFVGLSHEQGRLLTSPITGKPCLCYDLELSVAGKPCYRERQALPSVLRDGSGELELPLASAALEFSRKEAWRGSLALSPPPGLSESFREKLVQHVTAFVRRSGIPEDTSAELCVCSIDTGDPLFVTGEVIQGGRSVSLIEGRPVSISDRSFSELARREGLLGMLGVALSLFVVSAIVAVVRVLLARLTPS